MATGDSESQFSGVLVTEVRFARMEERVTGDITEMSRIDFFVAKFIIKNAERGKRPEGIKD